MGLSMIWMTEGITMLVPEDIDGEERQFTNGYGQDGYGRRRYRISLGNDFRINS